MKILIVDDHKIVAEGIKQLLLKSNQVSYADALTNPKAVIPYLNSHPIDVLLTDINMPELSGIELIEKIHPLFPSIQFGILSMYYNKHILSQCAKLNVKICLNKNVDFEELEVALENIKIKKEYIQQNIQNTLDTYSNLPLRNTHDILHILSKRELEVYALIMKSYKSYEIAEQLFVSLNTIKAHRKTILKKTGCKTVQELTILGIQLGLKID